MNEIKSMLPAKIVGTDHLDLLGSRHNDPYDAALAMPREDTGRGGPVEGGADRPG